MSRIDSTLDSHWCRDILACSTFLNHSINWRAAPGKVRSSVEWSEHRQWIALQFLSAVRMMRKLRWKQPAMKWLWEQCGYYAKSLCLIANKITQMYPWKHQPMHSSSCTRRSVFFETRKCRSLGTPKCITCWHGIPITYANKWFIRFMLQWRPFCIGLKRFPQQNTGNLRCTWIEPDKRQPLHQMLIVRRQLSDWSTKSIKLHL